MTLFTEAETNYPLSMSFPAEILSVAKTNQTSLCDLPFINLPHLQLWGSQGRDFINITSLFEFLNKNYFSKGCSTWSFHPYQKLLMTKVIKKTHLIHLWQMLRCKIGKFLGWIFLKLFIDLLSYGILDHQESMNVWTQCYPILHNPFEKPELFKESWQN